jgi:hypothetical protein
MKLTHMFCITLLAGIVSSPAFAVNENGTWYVVRNNSAGVSGFPMRPHVTNFCFLTQVSIEETDTSGEEAHCRVIKLGSDWWIQAILDKNANADVKCRATCFTKH